MTDDIMAQIEEELAPLVGNNTNHMTDLCQATAKMMFTHYDFQDKNILHAAWLSLVEPENYTSLVGGDTLTENTKDALKYLQAVTSLFPVMGDTTPFQGTCLSCLDGFLGSMNVESRCVLQALILMSTAALSKKKPEGLDMEIPEWDVIQNLSQEEFERRMAFLLVISHLLYIKEDGVDQQDQEKINKMHKDCLKIVTESSPSLAQIIEENSSVINI